MTYPVILIFRENDDFNVCLLPLESYPYLRVPQQGDFVPLVAKTTIQTKTRHGPVEDRDIIYLDGVYEVIKVWPGKGQRLHPTPGFTTYPLNEELEGYGIRVRKRILPRYDDIPKSKAVLIKGTWPPVAAR